MAQWWDIGRCKSGLIRDLHAYWTRKRGDRAMPSRADIDPGEIRHLLPNLLILDIEANPFRLRYRLLGTRVVAASGMDFTGRYLDEMVAADVEDQWEIYYRMVWSEKRPLFGTAIVPTLDGDRFIYEFALLPLSSDGVNVTQCVAIEDYGALNDRLYEFQEKTLPWQPRPLSTKKPG